MEDTSRKLSLLKTWGIIKDNEKENEESEENNQKLVLIISRSKILENNGN